MNIGNRSTASRASPDVTEDSDGFTIANRKRGKKKSADGASPSKRAKIASDAQSERKDNFRRGIIIPTLITQIKGILEQYPDDGQIVKEIIQNAEDAGATKVVFLMDHSTYGVDPSKLHHPGLAKYQGPALLAYNDASFTERDWRGIRTLHESIKADDPLKVGKFGLGFKSVFHMTDLPSIYSGQVVGFLDPHKRFFEVPVQGQSQPEKTTSYDWDFQTKEDLEEIRKLSHQFQPYKQDIFGTNGKGFGSKIFQGTMFRFPLRNETMHSDLSSNYYDGNKMKQLLKSLEAESDIIFLFLKNIRHIEFYEKINDETIKLLDIRVPDSHFVSVNVGRMELSAHITSNTLKWYTKDSKTVNYVLPVEVTKKGGEKKLTTWMMTQHFGGKSSQPSKEQSVDDSLPLVGIASKSICDHVALEPYGQIFCFMPLPQEEKSPTGFYFHVHGSFAVDQNRRHLKWMSADQDPSNITDKDLLWNNFLLEKLLPVCLENHYKFLVGEHKILIKNQMDIDSLQKAAINIYSILPNYDFVNHHWIKFVTTFRNSIIYSLELFSITTLIWKSKMTHILEDEKDELTNLNISILTKTNFDLAQLPKHLMQIVNESISNKLSADCICMNYKTVQQNNDLCTEHEKIILLQYFLENLTNVKVLQGIHLLPLMDDTWINFELKSSNNKIFICNEQYPDELFPVLKHQFLSSSKLPKNFYNKLIENFNLHQIDKNIFSNLLKMLLKTFVMDEIKLELWFNYKWLANVWICLKRDCQDLSMFIGLHLLLVSDDKVLKLTNKPSIIGTSLSEKGDKNFKNICHKLKINFVETHKNDIYNHPCLWDKIILPPRIKSILKFLMQMTEVEYSERFSGLTSHEIDYFVTSIVSEMSKQPLTNDNISILRKVKIFKTIKGSGKQNVELISLNDVNVSIKVGSSRSVPVPSFIKLVDLSNDSTRKLAKSLSIRLLDKKLLNEAYIPGIQNGFYTPKEVQLLMKHICKNFESISANSIAELKRLPFVSRGEDGLLARPQDLFDHKDETLTCLLSSDNFADKKWRNPEFHCALIKLGLKSLHDITSEDCFKLFENIGVKSLQQNKILLDFMNKRSHLLNETLRYQIKDICWIKIKKLKPYGYPKELKYLGEKAVGEYARSNYVISSEFEKVAGSTCLFTACKDLKNLEKLFGWDRRPSLDLIVQHFKNLIDIFPSNNLEMSDIVEEIYTILNSFSGEELNVVMDDNISWVWTGDRFVPPKMIVKNQPKIDLKPYVYALPKQFQQFKNLWKSLNISLEADFIKSLSFINDYHTTAGCSNRDIVNRDLSLAVNILNHLADDNTTIHERIFVPIQTNDNSSLQMQLIENCVYCDKNWYQNGFDFDDLDSSTHLINEKISMKTAEKLNIASCMSKLLNVEEFQCNWGQQESLTTRLKNILKEYTDGLTVLKELIQNADDAGATEINFVYDERRNENFRTILLDEQMKELQGAAIWCHNNANFSEDDFINITKLGGETKNYMSTKIGKFGLGFNSVYNLTEVPIFLSSNSIVIFDPHRKYLGKLLNNNSSPGIRLRLTGNHQKLSRLTDQFAPFNGMFGCDFTQKSENYHGTLYRFPLRTQAQSRLSKISNKHYSRNEVIQLFDCLMKAGGDLLLFAQNLCKITFYHIDENSTDPKMTEIYCVSRKISNAFLNVPQVENASYLKAASKYLHMRTNNEFMLLMEINEMFNPTDDFIHHGKKDKRNTWFVSWCTGTGESFELYLKNKTYLPIGSVAAKFSNDNNTDLDANLEGKMFCFLPLPLNNSFPVHVNGYFALNSSRTHIYTIDRNDKTDDRGNWNEALLEDAIAMAYCNLLRYMAWKISNHYCIFPSISHWQNISILVESLYSKLVELNLKVFRSIVDNEIYSLDECRIIGKELQDKCFNESVERVLISIAKIENKVIIKLPSNIYDCFQKMNAKINFQFKIIGLEKFYINWFIPNLDTIDRDDREKIIVETLIDIRTQRYLVNQICIPVTPGGNNLKNIRQLVNPKSRIALLYCNKEQMFPFVSDHMENKKSEYFRMLEVLGMRSNLLEVEEVIDRCHSIEKHPDTVVDRLPVLLGLIENLIKEQHFPHQSFADKIEFIRMFPSKLKPASYPLFWKRERPCLTSCREGFLENKMLIAGPSNDIIDDDQSFKGRYPDIKKFLRLKNKCISFESLKFLLLEIEKHFDKKTNYSIKQKDYENEIKLIIQAIYHEIYSMIGNNMLNQSEISELSHMRLILTNSQPCTLLLPSQCSKNIVRSLLPYMCGVSETSLANCSQEIHSIIGIKDCFLVDDFVQLLEKINNLFPGIQLEDPILKLVMAAIECLSHALLQEGIKLPECFLPNKHKVLCLSSQLRYNDCGWENIQSSEYCHDDISYAVSKRLGIKSVRQNHIESNRISIPFGQKEELVKRINRILTGYPLDESIFKEMLQNADDAMATEIHFINDSRNLSNEKIFCDEWKPLQGPALCVYNDKSFTLNDLIGIQKLGEGTKQNDITKTGQYGVGFNCVYHLTDAPSFLTTLNSETNDNYKDISGTVLAIFDPNCAFLPKSETDSSNPGALYKIEAIKNMFTDVYDGYLQNIGTYNVAQSGTLFRLPLRNGISKSKSDINGQIINLSKVETLLTDFFKKDPHLFLLFLKSIESIQVVNIFPGSSIKLIQNIRLQFTEEARAKKDQFMKSTKQLAVALQNKMYSLQQIKSQEVIYEVKVHDSKSKPSHWIIVNKFGFENVSKISRTLSYAYSAGLLSLQPVGGVAFKIENFYCDKNTLPRNKIFNFLPLPQNTNLPVHVNGHFFLNYEDRKGLWRDNEKSFQAEWNETVINQIIVPAYCSLLSYMKDRNVSGSITENQKNMIHFYDLFPRKQNDKYMNMLVDETYKYILENKLKLFTVYKPNKDEKNEWTFVDEQVYFDDLNAQFRPKYLCSDLKLINKLLEKAKLLRDNLFYCGMRIVTGPISLWNEFINAGFENIKQITEENVRCFLSSSPSFNNLPQRIENTPFKSVEGVVAVLEYISSCLLDDSKLVNLPFLLDSNNILNKATENNAVFESKYCGVAPNKLDQFVHPMVEPFFTKTKFKTKYVKQLNILDLPQLLNDFKNLFLDIDTLINMTVLDHYCYNRSKSNEWLKAVWKFIGDVFRSDASKSDESKSDESKSDENYLKSIQNLCIIPVTINDKEFLYRISKRSCVLRSEHEEIFKELFKSIKSVGVPILNEDIVNNHNIHRLFGNINKPSDLLKSLEEVYVNLKAINIPNKEEGLNILDYFSRNILSLNHHLNADISLKSLPFYIDMNDHQVAPNLRNVFIIHAGVPFFDTRVVQGQNVFLVDDYKLKYLFAFLKFKYLTVSETYTLFLFDAFKHFTSEKQLEHLEVIRNIASVNDHFIQRLKIFEFINYNGQLRKASYFYDRIEIFEIMETHFLPKPFDSWEWRNFVVKCGLVTKLSKEKFLEYAKKISSVNFNTSRVQSLMVDWLANNIKQKVDENFLEIIASIPFMYPSNIDKSLLELHPKFDNDRHVSFKNSNLLKNSRLCWTISNILPQMVDQLMPFFDLLNVKTTVDSNIVLSNLRNISDSFKKRTMIDGIDDLIESLTEEHLSWFNAKTLDEQTLNELKNIKCLFVDEMHALVRPDQVVVEFCSEDQINPYIMKMPTFYGKCRNLLYQLGATKYITVEQCARALEELRNVVKDNKMDPNNTNIAQKLFKTLLKKLDGEITSEFDSLKRLYVPCEGDILCDSKGIYCSSNRLINLKKMILDRPVILDNVELLLKLPALIRPIHLDEYLTEKIASVGKDTTVHNIENLKKNLKHPNFLDGLLRIKYNMPEHVNDNSSEAMDSEYLDTKLKNITIFEKEIISVHHILNGNVVEHSQKEAFYFIKHCLRNNYIEIYVAPEVKLPFLMPKLSAKLASFFEIPEGCYLIKEILNVDPQDIDCLLDELKLSSLDYVKKPALGTEIEIEDHFCLVQDFSIFYPGQLVAHEIDDPLDRGEDGVPKYMLVEIITKQENVKNISRLQMEYEINCGTYKLVVSALKLYAFATTVDNKTQIISLSNNFKSEPACFKTPTNVSEIIEELKVILKEIWKLEELERKKAIKRLYLRYHPDKNPDYRQLYDEVFKHLKILINKLENKQSIDDYNIKSTNQNNYQKPFDFNNYNQDYFERMNRRANQHHYAKTKKGEKTYQNMYGSPQRTVRAFFNNLSKKGRNDPKNAELWMKQAHHDAKVAVNDINSNLKSPQWVCIKFYQAIKNAITAVNYSKDANQMPIIKNQLKDICSEVYDQDLDSLVEQADRILVNFEYLTQPHINHPAFENITQTMADNVSEIAKKIICRCDELIAFYNSR